MPKISMLVLPLLILGGCKDNGSTLRPSPAVFQIDLQSHFVDDSVRVQVDSRIVFEGRVTTHDIFGLAKSISVDANTGPHDVRIQVVHPYTGSEKDTTIIVTDTLTVAVNIDERSRTLHFNLYPFLLLYE
jgi:hypothetical protein